LQRKNNTGFGLSSKELISIQDVLRSYPGIKPAFIFGSRAKGDFRPGSDIDIALEGEGLTVGDQLSVLGMLDELNLPYLIDLVILDRIESKDLVEQIHRVGREFFLSKNKW